MCTNRIPTSNTKLIKIVVLNYNQNKMKKFVIIQKCDYSGLRRLCSLYSQTIE